MAERVFFSFGRLTCERRWQSMLGFCRLGFCSLMAAGLACPVLGSSHPQADTVAYWRFEDSPGFLEDSGPNNLDLIQENTGAASAGPADLPFQEAIPANGPGSAFDDALAGNASLAVYPFKRGFLSVPDNAALTFTDITVEAFVNNPSTPAGGTAKFIDQIVSQWNFGSDPGPDDKGWGVAISDDINGTSTTDPNRLYFQGSTDGTDTPLIQGPFIEKDKDYYVAVSYDSSTGTATFYSQNLTDGTPREVMSSSTTDTGVTLGVLYDSSQDLRLGSLVSSGTAFGNNRAYTGVLDEVRISNVVLSNSELLLPGVDGDFDGDEDVDGADFLKWQLDLGDAANLAPWEANYGTPPSVAAVAVVPEPASWILVCTMSMVVARRRRRPSNT